MLGQKKLVNTDTQQIKRQQEQEKFFEKLVAGKLIPYPQTYQQYKIQNETKHINHEALKGIWVDNAVEYKLRAYSGSFLKSVKFDENEPVEKISDEIGRHLIGSLIDLL